MKHKSAGAFLTLLSGFTLETRPDALVSLASYCQLTRDEFTVPDPFYLQEDEAVDENEARQTIGRKQKSTHPGT